MAAGGPAALAAMPCLMRSVKAAFLECYDPVGHGVDDGWVVGDEEVGEVLGLLQGLQQAEDFGLGGGV